MIKKIFKKFVYKLVWDFSTTKNQTIEFSSTRLCPVGCKYCPQSLLKSVTNKDINSKNLTFINFKKYLSNVSKNNLKIMWTGYSEPLLNKEFPLMADYAKKLGIEQEISTTLTGQDKCIDYLCTSNSLSKIMLHLPDDNSLMESGFLKVDENYIDRFRKVLSILEKENHPKIKLVCFGKDYHPKLKEIIMEEEYFSKIGKYKPRRYLGSRSGAIKAIWPGLISGKIGGFFRKGSRIPISKFYTFVLKNFIPKTNIYYCSYKRLNQPVILGDGKMNICCNDYSLRGIIGDLSSGNLNDIYKNWYFENGDKLIKGKLEPCVDCEYYRVLGVNDFVNFYFLALKKKIKKFFY